VIPYEAGMVIPPGYHREERIKTPLVVAGASTLGGLWLISTVIALGTDDDYYALAIPVVGPFIMMTSDKIRGLATVIAYPFLIADGLGQVAGAALLIAGAVKRDVLVRDSTGKIEPKPELLVGPGSIGMRVRF
jgi:hypothetical protein